MIEKFENYQLQTTHQDIASDLGTSREVVSRILKEFERKGQIALYRNIIQLLKLAQQACLSLLNVSKTQNCQYEHPV